MNTIQLLAAQPWVERMAWTLLHFLWQGVLIAAAYAAIRKSVGRPDRRYLLACAALACMTAAPVITWNTLRPEVSSGNVVPAKYVPAGADAPATDGVVTAAAFRSLARTMPAPLLPWVVAAWLAGAMAFWFRLLGGWIGTVRLRSRLVRAAPGEWQRSLDRLKTQIRVSRPVRLLVSGLVQAPAVVGWLRPVVLVPVGALAGLPAGQMEALLLHELAHIRRHDYLVNVMQSVIEALLFYHPAVWWISGHMRSERELCCDDVAVGLSGDTLTYVRALADLEAARPARFAAAMMVTGGSLAHRIGRLLGQPRSASHSFAASGIMAAATLPVILAFAVFAQPAPRPKFDVASIKPSRERNFQMVRPQPGRLSANASLQLLMQNAYAVQPFQIVGGPVWIGSDRFEIEAKADANVSRADLFLMLQSLLEERFQLKIHRETKELPVYALVAAKSGLKLPPPKEGSCVDPPPDAPNEWAGGRMAPPGTTQTGPARCGGVRVSLGMSGASLQGGKVPMAELIRTLSMVLGRPVIDRTGYAKLFDVQLGFQPDEITGAMPPPPPGTTGIGGDAPTILTALQEQLGLRLESTKGPVEAIVIDKVERPTAN